MTSKYGFTCQGAVNKKVFTRAIKTRGGLVSSFVFEDLRQENLWLDRVLPGLQEKYGDLKVERVALPGLSVGDACHVFGEADDVFVIVGVLEYAPDRYGFLLDSGVTEEVVKCWAVTR